MGTLDTVFDTLAGIGEGFVDFDFAMSRSFNEKGEVERLIVEVQNLYSTLGNKQRVSAYVHGESNDELDLVKAFVDTHARKYRAETDEFEQKGE